MVCVEFSLGLLVILQLITTQAGWLLPLHDIIRYLCQAPFLRAIFIEPLSESQSDSFRNPRSRVLMSKPLEHTFGPFSQVSGTELAPITVSRTTRYGVHMNPM